MLISVIIPAFNEEAYLGNTLASINRAKDLLLRTEESGARIAAEIIVVDNASNDATGKVASALGLIVVSEMKHNVATVRNAGAQASHGDVLVFVDADTTVPDKLLLRIAHAMSDSHCFGGAVDTDYHPEKLCVKLYLQFWRILGSLTGMAQGATQFCRRNIFFELNGYDESLFMGEDVDFYWRMKRSARRQQAHVYFIDDMQVATSSRRFDQWSFSRTLLWTNPIFVWAFRRQARAGNGWYRFIPR